MVLFQHDPHVYASRSYLKAPRTKKYCRSGATRRDGTVSTREQGANFSLGKASEGFNVTYCCPITRPSIHHILFWQMK